ncbi:MAG: FkbM family methyltransferase [Clostridiales bacterium]|nr:FkbM family methyltransferase [Clostridiales bacterium]
MPDFMPMCDIWQHLRESDKPVVLYGTGDGADKIIAQLKRIGIYDRVKGIFASDGFVRKRNFAGFEVESYSECMARLGDPLILMCFGSSRPEVLENVMRISSEHEFYAPDVPVYGDNLFDMDYYNVNSGRIAAVRELLADEDSRRAYDLILANKLSGDVSLLRKCECREADIEALLPVGKGGTFVDLGAYNGDTALWYAGFDPSFGKIIAVEPDERNFRKLRENTSHLSERMEYVNALIGAEDGMTMIDTRKGRGVHREDVTNPDSSNAAYLKEMKITSVDSLLGGRAADLIKMDVEGAEKDAIAGAADTILKYRPAMRIACYHRSEDIFELPLQVLSIRDDYKVYIKHKPHVLGWDTEFVFV